MFPQKIHRALFLFGACSLAFGMMLGAVPTSVPQFILLGNWILEGRFNEKWQQLRSNKIFWALISFFWLHVAGLLYTVNFSEGFSDIRIKVPIFFLALVFFSSKPLSQKEFRGVLACFLLGCFCNTAWCVIYNFVLYHNEVGRDASRFMSHIRLGLYLNMAIAGCVYLTYEFANRYYRTGLILLAIYFLIIMFVLGLASGLSGFFILAFFGACAIIYSQKALVKLISLALVVILSFVIARYVLKVKEEQLTVQQSKNNSIIKLNVRGHGYLAFDTLNGQKENGNYVMINIQLEELKQEWQRRVPSDSFSYNPQPHNLNRFNILVRYLASRGLNKDSAGIAELTAEDLADIQKNIGNYRYPHWNFLHKRVYELINEYDDFAYHRSVNGHSLTMRLYFWKAAAQVIRQHGLFGVGTGDVQQAMTTAYVETRSPLQPEWYKRPHNQFLTTTVTFGITGLLILLLSLLYPVLSLKNYLPVLFWPFFILAIASFFMEDTLESQAGLTFYAFFNTLFLSVSWFKKLQKKDSADGSIHSSVKTPQTPGD